MYLMDLLLLVHLEHLVLLDFQLDLHYLKYLLILIFLIVLKHLLHLMHHVFQKILMLQSYHDYLMYLQLHDYLLFLQYQMYHLYQKIPKDLSMQLSKNYTSLNLQIVMV
jgi:hypothetical protein